MQLHASCGARNGCGVLIVGPPGSGKSSTLLRLMALGFRLVADDQVVVDDGRASAPVALAGVMEVRGLGLARFAHLRSARLALAVELGEETRLPTRRTHFNTGLPILTVRPHCHLTPKRISLALSIVAGRSMLVSGAFA